jgi:GAF domain-containing protein
VEPIPETRELLELLKVGPDSDRLESWLYSRAQQVAALIPDCVGVSIALFGEEAVTFTFVITAESLRLIDAAQFLDGGPCQESARSDVTLATDVLSEQRWHLFALAEAATGVQSSLSLPLRADGAPSGSVNFYGSRPDTFTDRARELATLFGAAADDAVSNADLPMTGLQRARTSAQQVRADARLDIAIGILAERQGLPIEEARERLHDAAARAGIEVGALARLLLVGEGHPSP